MTELTDHEQAARLLIVEDDPRISAVLAKGLRKQGFATDSVATGAAAIARVEAGGIALLLLDLGLPDVDGLEVLRVLRERGETLPVVVITARSDPRDRGGAIDLGADAYLTKPFAWTDVWTSVRRCLAAHGQA